MGFSQLHLRLNQQELGSLQIIAILTDKMMLDHGILRYPIFEQTYVLQHWIVELGVIQKSRRNGNSFEANISSGNTLSRVKISSDALHQTK